MTSKQKVVIWANCQGLPISWFLTKYYSQIYDVIYLANFEMIKNESTIPDDFYNADIFIYQNYSDKPDCSYDLKNILNNILKTECIKICFPTLHSCHLIFCYDTYEPNNDKTITKDLPFGKFLFGIKDISDMVTSDIAQPNTLTTSIKSDIIEKIITVSNSDTFISEQQIKYYHDRSFDFFEKKILKSDIPNLYHFIKNNFCKHRLWHNPNHPTGILLNELLKEIFAVLKLPYYESDENLNILDHMLSDWAMPIFPCVKKYYNMVFDDKCCSWYHPNITNNQTYIAKYINDIYFTL
jgi:hypothetical protein